VPFFTFYVFSFQGTYPISIAILLFTSQTTPAPNVTKVLLLEALIAEKPVPLPLSRVLFVTGAL